MSYRVNIKFETTKGKEPWMHAHDVVRIHDENEELPESNFVQQVYKEAISRVTTKFPCAKCKTQNDADAKHCKDCGAKLIPPNTSTRVELKKLWWSGNHASESLESVAPYVHGRLEAFFVGEDGEVFGGAIIEDGTYTKCSVEMKLVPETNGKRRQP